MWIIHNNMCLEGGTCPGRVVFLGVQAQMLVDVDNIQLVYITTYSWQKTYKKTETETETDAAGEKEPLLAKAASLAVSLAAFFATGAGGRELYGAHIVVHQVVDKLVVSEGRRCCRRRLRLLLSILCSLLRNMNCMRLLLRIKRQRRLGLLLPMSLARRRRSVRESK